MSTVSLSQVKRRICISEDISDSALQAPAFLSESNGRSTSSSTTGTSPPPISFATAEADGTGRITQPSSTQVGLEPGTYFVTYHISAVLETAGYLQITPSYSGGAHLEYGVYGRTADDSVTVSGSSSFIAVVPSATTLSLNVNSSAATRDGTMTMVILGLRGGDDN